MKNNKLIITDFEAFKSNICHRVKSNGNINFIIDILQSNDIRTLWDKGLCTEAMYLLAMVDYLSRLEDIPLCGNYEDIRPRSLKEPLFPRDVCLADKLAPALCVKQKCMEKAISEFLRHNIVETDIFDVC